VRQQIRQRHPPVRRMHDGTKRGKKFGQGEVPVELPLFNQTGASPFTIVRKDERAPTSRVASKEGVRYGYSYESLAPDKVNRSMEPFIVTLEPAEKKGVPYNHEGEEFLFVLEGRVEVQLGSYSDVLEPGDSIYYDSTTPHRVACMGDTPAKILAVIYTS